MTTVKDIEEIFFDPDETRLKGHIELRCQGLLEEALKEAAPQLKMQYPEVIRFLLKTAIAGMVRDGEIKLSFFPKSKK